MRRLLVLLMLVGCETEVLDTGAVGDLATVAAPLRLALAPGEVLLDARGERALIGVPMPAPEHADPTLLMRVRYVVSGQARPWPMDGQIVSQAGLLPGGGFTVTSPDGGLSVISAGGEQRMVDEHVTGAVAVSADGQRLAYARGEAPDLEIWRADLRTGATAAATTGMAPAWSPGLSADGEVLVFASAATGVPALWRQVAGASPEQLTNVGVRPAPGEVPVLAPFPAGLAATRVSEAVIAFEGRGEVHLLGPDGQVIRSAPGASPWLGADGSVWAVWQGEAVRLEGGQP